MTDEPNSAWNQVNLWCKSWQAAERMAAERLQPLLTAAEDAGNLSSWWFIRKRESWRLRLLPAPGREDAQAALLTRLTATLTESGAIRGYATGVVYEPETRRFGGPEAIELAHGLFHTDSRHILNHLAHHRGRDLRRELGIRLATRMMQAANQDFYEQGDIWAALAEHRATADSPEPAAATLAAVQMLITADGDAASSPLTQTPAWPSAFEDAGAALAGLARHGRLTRGIRAVLAAHLVFAFNRLGISADHQAALATAANRVIFHRQPTPDRPLRVPALPSLSPLQSGQ